MIIAIRILLGLFSVASLAAFISTARTLLRRLFHRPVSAPPAELENQVNTEIGLGMLAYAVVFLAVVGCYFGWIAVNGLLDPASQPDPINPLLPDFSDF